MILFRQSDPNYPFLWESDAQFAQRWHAEGDGPAHYFTTTADGAWAEFLRHEEIKDPEELKGLRERAVWVVEIDMNSSLFNVIDLPQSVLTGGEETWPECQREAARIRHETGTNMIRVPSAALKYPGATMYYVDGGQKTVDIDSEVIVIFGPQPELRAHLAARGRPNPRILERVRHRPERKNGRNK
ncbi:MAG TPA: hypothetical protein VFD39_10760 [Trueperaceae bacterium]|nr:hypothetical protein [Trueperaceae bacterium]